MSLGEKKEAKPPPIGKKRGQWPKAPAPDAAVPAFRKPEEPAPPVLPAEEAPEPEVRRARYHYDYYPQANVYFDTVRHLYFYRTEGGWTMSVALPAVFQKELGARVRLEMTDDRPYVEHEKHREKYPPTDR